MIHMDYLLIGIILGIGILMIYIYRRSLQGRMREPLDLVKTGVLIVLGLILGMQFFAESTADILDMLWPMTLLACFAIVGLRVMRYVQHHDWTHRD